MNERIRELAKQTGYIWHASGEPQIYEFTPEKLEKFAKLIVSECMDVLDPGENQLIARFQARQWLAEHFGIEE
jgi:L-2-hydroxyglutarate oxidase LhgO